MAICLLCRTTLYSGYKAENGAIIFFKSDKIQYFILWSFNGEKIIVLVPLKMFRWIQGINFAALFDTWIQGIYFAAFFESFFRVIFLRVLSFLLALNVTDL